MANVKSRFRLADNVADNWISGKGADFVEDWRDGLGLEFISPAGELDVPKLQHYRIFAITESVFAELFVGKHASNIEHGSLGPIEQR